MLIKTAGKIFIAIILIGGFILFKSKRDTALAVLLKTSSILPLSPQLSTKGDNLCKEKPSGIPVLVQSQSIIPVFKRDGSKQCEEVQGIPAEKMAEELKTAGVKVFKSVKGKQVGSTRELAVCGAPTSNINIFYISSKKKSEALKIGFQKCIENNYIKNK